MKKASNDPDRAGSYFSPIRFDFWRSEEEFSGYAIGECSCCSHYKCCEDPKNEAIASQCKITNTGSKPLYIYSALLESSICLKADPTLWVAHFYLGLVYRAQGRLEAAEATFQNALKQNESSSTLNVLGVVQLELGLKGLAQESFRRALVSDPRDAEVLYNLATTLNVNSRNEAVALFERAIEVDPEYSLAHRELLR